MQFFRVLPRMAAWAIAVMLPVAAQASPMGFKDSWMSMGDLGTNWREVYANYAVTVRDAFGMANTYMRSDDRQRSLDLTDITYTRLLHRWNLRDAQANFWLVTGLGAARLHDSATGDSDTRAMASPGIQFDYETTRVYFATMGRLYRGHGINHDFGSVRTGFSFYETDYDETQPWFIVEARRMRGLSDKTEITPMIRLVNKSYFIEAGVNNSRQARLNFMYIF
jgi:hypothetical protein